MRRLRSLLSELGDVPALPHDLGSSPGTTRRSAWQLCELAPLNLVDRQQLLASVGLRGPAATSSPSCATPWPTTWSALLAGRVRELSRPEPDAPCAGRAVR